MTMKVSRFALTYSPQTLMVEYRDLTDDSKYVKKINIKNIANVKVRLCVNACISWLFS